MYLTEVKALNIMPLLEYPNNQQLHVVSVADSKSCLDAVLKYLNNIVTRSNKQLISVAERKTAATALVL